jgi:hypothetical protein
VLPTPGLAVAHVKTFAHIGIAVKNTGSARARRHWIGKKSRELPYFFFWPEILHTHQKSAVFIVKTTWEK